MSSLESQWRKNAKANARRKGGKAEELDRMYSEANWDTEERITKNKKMRIEVPELPQEILDNEPRWLLDARYALIGVAQMLQNLAQSNDVIIRDRLAAMVQGVAPFKFGVGEPEGHNIITEITLNGGKAGLKDVLRNADGTLPEFTEEDDTLNTPATTFEDESWKVLMPYIGRDMLT